MIRSKKIALRCAKAIDPRLLCHKWRSAKTERGYEVYGLNRKTIGLLRQLDACKDDAARRLILGKSR